MQDDSGMSDCPLPILNILFNSRKVGCLLLNTPPPKVRLWRRVYRIAANGMIVKDTHRLCSGAGAKCGLGPAQATGDIIITDFEGKGRSTGKEKGIAASWTSRAY